MPLGIYLRETQAFACITCIQMSVRALFVENERLPSSRRLLRQTAVRARRGALPSNKKEQAIDTHNLDGSQGQNAELKKKEKHFQKVI